MSHFETNSAPSHRESSAKRQRNHSGAAGSDQSQRRVKSKSSTNGTVVDRRVLCPIYAYNRKAPYKASCWLKGFSEVAKMRDHLKDVHNLSKKQLDQLNFKGGQFRSLKTLDEKWKHAFKILYPHVSNDKIPEPWKNDDSHDYNSEKMLLAAVSTSGSITKDEETSGRHIDFTSLSARLQNWLFDRLSTTANVPNGTKLDIIAEFGTAFDYIVADIAGGGDLSTINALNFMPHGDSKINLQDLALDWGTLANDVPTPKFDICSEDKRTPELHFNKSFISDTNTAPETERVCETFHGLPNPLLLATLPTSYSSYNYMATNVAQPFITGGPQPADQKHSWGSSYPPSPPKLTPITSADEKEAQDLGSELPTPPATPTECDSPLDVKVVLQPDSSNVDKIFIPPAEFTTDELSAIITSDDMVQEELEFSDYIKYPEDEQFYQSDMEIDQYFWSDHYHKRYYYDSEMT